MSILAEESHTGARCRKPHRRREGHPAGVRPGIGGEEDAVPVEAVRLGHMGEQRASGPNFFCRPACVKSRRCPDGLLRRWQRHFVEVREDFLEPSGPG